MKEEKTKIKVEDKFLLELGQRLLGYRLILDGIAFRLAETQKQFWQKAKELYNLDDKKEYYFDHVNNEIGERN
jgi:hypothetical protein